MIANFYKKNGIEARNYKLLASKNIDCIPQKRNFYHVFWATIYSRQSIL